MSSGKRGRGGGRPRGTRHVTEDEEKLWSLLTTTMEPLKRAKKRVVPALEGTPATVPARKIAAAHHPAPEPHRHAAASGKPPLAPAKPSGPPIAAFERRVVRKVAGGQIEIDARLDLHGLKAEEARHDLRNFILSCAARELRLVLVITGKGRPRESSDDVITASERGILRRLVPLWLAEHELRAAVVSFASAHARHGGEGALYVRLRRRRR